MPASGLLLSQPLAELLGAKPGDTLRVEVQEGRRPTLDAVLAGTITDFSGVGAYMEIGALRRLLAGGRHRQRGTRNGGQASWDEFPRAGEGVAANRVLAITEASRKSFSKTTGQMMGTIQAIYFTFAVIVAFGVVYNSARIALSERNRDLATLRVIGFSHGKSPQF